MEIVEIKSFRGQGYQALMSYGTWRAAVLRYFEATQPEKVHQMERHTMTDEVFILTEGKAILLISGNLSQLGTIESIEMKTGEFYNVKRNTWHAVLMSHDANIVIVENDDTGLENTEYSNLTDSHIASINRLADVFYANGNSQRATNSLQGDPK